MRQKIEFYARTRAGGTDGTACNQIRQARRFFRLKLRDNPANLGRLRNLDSICGSNDILDPDINGIVIMLR